MSSNTIRTARARTSGEYGGIGLVMAPSFQDQEPPENPVRFRALRNVGMREPAIPSSSWQRARPRGSTVPRWPYGAL